MFEFRTKKITSLTELLFIIFTSEIKGITQEATTLIVSVVLWKFMTLSLFSHKTIFLPSSVFWWN